MLLGLAIGGTPRLQRVWGPKPYTLNPFFFVFFFFGGGGGVRQKTTRIATNSPSGLGFRVSGLTYSKLSSLTNPPRSPQQQVARNPQPLEFRV